jgi:hypothetical protein
MKKSPLPYFTRFLQQIPKDEKDAEYYENNKHLAKDIGIKVMYENNYNFLDLVDKAPVELHNKKECGISLDILWAEDQIDLAYYFPNHQ